MGLDEGIVQTIMRVMDITIVFWIWEFKLNNLFKVWGY